jgi:hypothetical protein
VWGSEEDGARAFKCREDKRSADRFDNSSGSRNIAGVTPTECGTDRVGFYFLDKFYLAVTFIAINVPRAVLFSGAYALPLPLLFIAADPQFFTPTRNHSRVSIRCRLFMFLSSVAA